MVVVLVFVPCYVSADMAASPIPTYSTLYSNMLSTKIQQLTISEMFQYRTLASSNTTKRISECTNLTESIKSCANIVKFKSIPAKNQTIVVKLMEGFSIKKYPMFQDNQIYIQNFKRQNLYLPG